MRGVFPVSDGARRRVGRGDWCRLPGVGPVGRALAGVLRCSSRPSRRCSGPEDSYVGCRSRRCSYPASTTEVASVIADLDTGCGELYASRGEVLPAGQADSEGAGAVGGGGRGSPGEAAGGDSFTASREGFESLVGFLDGADAAGLSHAELEEHLDVHGRELLRCLLGDHLALRAVREPRLEQVTGDEGGMRSRVGEGRRLERVTGGEGVVRSRVEKGHGRARETVFGTVSVERLAYRAPGVGN